MPSFFYNQPEKIESPQARPAVVIPTTIAGRSVGPRYHAAAFCVPFLPLAQGPVVSTSEVKGDLWLCSDWDWNLKPCISYHKFCSRGKHFSLIQIYNGV